MSDTVYSRIFILRNIKERLAMLNCKLSENSHRPEALPMKRHIMTEHGSKAVALLESFVGCFMLPPHLASCVLMECSPWVSPKVAKAEESVNMLDTVCCN